MGTGTRYPKELKEHAVRLVLEERDQHPSEWAAITSVAEKLGCGTERANEILRKASAYFAQAELDRRHS